MSLIEEKGGLSAADIAAVTGNNSGWGNGDNSFWLFILFLFAFMGNGWGNGYGYGGGGAAVDADIQRGFDQQSIMGGINGLTAAVSNGFANAEISRCNSQTNLLQTLSGMQMAQQQCCCDNRAGLADLKYTVATEACADRQAVTDALTAVTTAMNAGFQSVHDQMCQDKIDAKNDEIANLRTQLSMKDLAASQTAQTAQLLADNNRQTAVLEDYLNPVPRPSYIVQNPNCCAPSIGGCGCSIA